MSQIDSRAESAARDEAYQKQKNARSHYGEIYQVGSDRHLSIFVYVEWKIEYAMLYGQYSTVIPPTCKAGVA